MHALRGGNWASVTECFASAARGHRQRNSSDQVLPEWSQDPSRGSAEGQQRGVVLRCGSSQGCTPTNSALRRKGCPVAFLPTWGLRQPSSSESGRSVPFGVQKCFWQGLGLGSLGPGRLLWSLTWGLLRALLADPDGESLWRDLLRGWRSGSGEGKGGGEELPY